MDTEKAQRKSKIRDPKKPLIQSRPFYFNEMNKYNTLIEDKLLFIYEDFFNIPDLKTAPIDHPLIPSLVPGEIFRTLKLIVTYDKEIGFFS